MATESTVTGEARERRGMKAERVFIVARKEFTDQITGWRFPVILALFLAIALAGTYIGVVDYERELDRYTQELEAMDDPVDESERVMMPSKPPVKGIYCTMFLALVSYAGLLAIAIGFDLVSGEKESRSLKSLLSRPVYRDEIINGKALGGVALLVLAVGGVLLTATALLLIFSIVPSPDDLWVILTYAGVTLLFLVTFFSIALAFSTLCRESGSALLLSVVAFILLASVIPYAFAQVGIMMEEPDLAAYGGDGSSEEYQAEITAYYGQMDLIESVKNLLSPQAAVNNLINELSYFPRTTLALEDTLGEIWSSVVALIFYPAVFFAIAYIRFLRMDIR
jgi:ABC-2 type transport system permease protein